MIKLLLSASLDWQEERFLPIAETEKSFSDHIADTEIRQAWQAATSGES